MLALQEHNLVVDILPHCDFLPEIAAFIGQHPDVTFVLDHLGGIPIHARGSSDWFDALCMFAPLPNVVIKFSGYTRSDKISAVSILRDYLDVMVEIVGAERMMFGSNWPICLNAASYTDTIQGLQAACAHLDTEMQSALFHGTATATYRMAHKKESAARP
jgi:L-fuconolactonase